MTRSKLGQHVVKVTFRQDGLDCAQSYPDSGLGIHVKQRIACMNLKGWH